MYQDKHGKTQVFSKKMIVLLAALFLIFTVSAGGTLAYLITSTDDVTNTFTPSEVEITLKEDFDGSTKENVKVTNTGDTDAYIRAAVVVTWKKDGAIYGKVPDEGKDYRIEWTKDGWTEGSDGFYYYKEPVAAKGETGVLFTECAPVIANIPEGYKFHVEVIAQGVQSKPSNAVVEAWGVTVKSDGSIRK